MSLPGLPSNTNTLLHSGAVAHLHLTDAEEPGVPSLVRVVYSDTIGVAVVFSGYESWSEYVTHVQEDHLVPLLVTERKPHFYPWHRIDEISLVTTVQGYNYWYSQQQSAEEVVA